MQLETKLEGLAARLPARQRTLEFLGDNTWQELSRDDQQACRQAVANVLLQVLRDEPHNETNSNTQEEDEHE